MFYRIDETVEYPADITVNICISPQKKGIQVDILNPALYNAASVNPIPNQSMSPNIKMRIEGLPTIVPLTSAMNSPETTYRIGINMAHFVLRKYTLHAHNPAARNTTPKMANVQNSVNFQMSSLSFVFVGGGKPVA